MTIDWITVSAQIVNFLILVWLLKHFLYQPILRAMGKRENHIRQRLTEADDREHKADEQIHRYQEKQQALEKDQDAVLNQAKQDAEEEKKQLLQKARQEVDEIRRNWQRQANEEKNEFLANLSRQSADAFQAMARKALRDLADAELEERIIHIFLQRLNTLDQSTKQILSDSDENICVTSSFELDDSQRESITKVIHDVIGGNVNVDFLQSDDLLCGIELTRSGQELSWNLAKYLEDINTRIEKSFSSMEGNT
jgi:F-type H+-transporting ATPase subunit b